MRTKSHAVEDRSTFVKILHPFFVFATYLFLYIPIFVIAMFSFNESRFSTGWTGFSLKWYGKLFSSPDLLDALFVSLVVAVCSTIISVLIGTCLVVASKWWRPWLAVALFYPNIILPDIALAIGVLSVFAFFKVFLFPLFDRGLWSWIRC